MPDADLQWGGDLSLSPTGDILLADGGILSQQRVLRRLLTNTTDYIWQPNYGAGLGQFVGQANVARTATGVIYAQLVNEASVSQLPLPMVNVQPLAGDIVLAGITYTDAVTTTTQALTFTVGT
jgi:hypothetical protein